MTIAYRVTSQFLVVNTESQPAMIRHLLPVLLVSATCTAQFTKLVTQKDADVPAGDSSLCWLAKLDPDILYTGFKPRINPETEDIAYISIYSCHSTSLTELKRWEEVSNECSAASYLAVRESCGQRLMFIWSSSMGSSYQERLPAEISGIMTGASGYAMLVATYVDVKSAFKDSSGLELTEASGPVPSGKEGGRLIIGHQLPRMIVFGGVEEWKVYSVCHRSCLKEMDQESLTMSKVSVFTGSRGISSRLGVAYDEGMEVGEDIINISLNKGGFAEENVSANLTGDTDLWLECVYNTVDTDTTFLGGVGKDLEHCFAVLTYVAKTSITSCKSQPTDYSVLYALDIYLQNEDYNTYEDYYIDDAFESVEDSDDYYADAFQRRKKRNSFGGLKALRSKREAYEVIEDDFFSKLTDDKRLVSKKL